MKKICILNASNPVDIHLESDSYLDLRNRTSCFNDGKIIKQCRSWHSWAYCLETEFFVYNKENWQGCLKYDCIIILVNRDIHNLFPLLKKLKLMKKEIAIALHEGVQDFLYKNPNEWITLKKLVTEAGTYITFLGQYLSFFKGLFQDSNVIHVNHTNPFDWSSDLIIPWEKRIGDILIGTRTFNNYLSRNTLISIAAFSGWQRKNKNRRIDFICEDNADAVLKLIEDFGFDNINIHYGPLEYNNWLKLISNYKYLCHHDTSLNLGQISLDALMLNVVPVGGTTWINQMIGTDDMGSADVMLRFIEYSKNLYLPELDIVKKLLHPDKIKERLIEVFK